MGLKSCCNSKCLFLLVTLIVIFYARTMQVVASLTPFMSEQQLAEMWWWTRFLFLSSSTLAPEALPLSKLQHHHSNLNVIEYWVHNDSEAVTKFLEGAGKNANDDNIYILRGVWANNTETKLRNMKSIDDLAQLLNMDRTYETTIAPLNAYKSYETKTMTEVLENLPKKDSLWGLTFDFRFLETQDNFYDEYINVFRTLDERLEQRILKDKLTSHTFLYHGVEWVSHLHAAPVADYFIQIANIKRWRFIHKAYSPYVGTVKATVPGVSFLLQTPVYFHEDYPEPSIPYVEFDLHPGDLLWFGSWHWHQVRNVQNQIGLAIGIRPKKNLLDDAFQPMTVYNIMNLGSLMQRKIVMSMPGYSYAELEKKKAGCHNKYHKQYASVWNGTRMHRYDFRTNDDGLCEFAPREFDYQRKEISKEFSEYDWRPLSI